MKRIAVYKRVSTDKQDTDMQQHAITKWLLTQPAAHITWYEDIGISGSTANRPDYQRLLTDVEAGKVDTVVVYRLDRLSRKAVDAMSLMIDWIRKDIGFVAVDQPILHLDKSNQFRLTFASLISEIAQIERETIVARINAGMAAAKARGVHIGRRRKLSATQTEDIARLRRSGRTLEELAAMYSVSQATIFNMLKHRA